MSESQDWTLACGGDAAAFGRVFDLHYARVLRHAARVTDDRHEAEDAVATAFLELWRRRREVRLVDGSPLPWLLVTATGCAQNVRRSSWRYRRLLARLPRDEVTVEDPAQVVTEAELEPALVRGLRSLSLPDRQLLTLVAVEGFAVVDAAAVLGLTPTAARSRLHRARARLRAGLEGSSHAPSPVAALQEER